jgi:hypothetical protein
MPDPDSIITPIKKSLRNLQIATGVLIVVLIAVAGYAYFQADRTTAALCDVRVALQTDVDQSKEILETNPEVIENLGIPPEIIEQQTADQQRTIDALEPLNCPVT